MRDCCLRVKTHDRTRCANPPRLHAENSYRGRSLDSPAFDIHFNARAEGHDGSKKQELKYALIISVKARRMTDLYNRIVRRYRGTLEALLPVIEIPVKVDSGED